ncbi:hypothetical protein [Bacillus sp. JJ722]|uniref:hypothetical protein n=1 Tax=Bacillus sp. JJ722 TaxID=3122973 RepID=UPI0030003CBB
MYVSRDLTELSLLQKKDWKDSELQYFHHSLQQMLPYLNVQGQSILKQIIKEIQNRGGFQHNEADYTHDTDLIVD